MFNKREIRNFLILNFGLILLALTSVFLFTPSRLTPGGLYSVSLIIFNLLGLEQRASTSIGIIAFLLNIPLLAYMWKKFGRETFLKNTYGALFFPIFIIIIDKVIQFFGLNIVQPNVYLTAILGGILQGVSIGIAIGAKGSTGGTDIIALIINGFLPFISIGRAIILINTLILLSALFIFGLLKAILSLIAIFLTGYFVDLVLKHIFKQDV